MASWNVFRWLRDSSSKVSSRQRPSSIRLNLEFLEPRLAPATFTVMDNSDSATDTGSLRFALANVAAGTTIDFAPSVRDIVLTSNTTLMVNTNVNIVNDLRIGPVTIDGNNATTVFTVVNGVTASLSGLTISNGNAAAFSDGGGILNNGLLTVSGCTFSANTATNGGAIYNFSGATLIVNGSTFSDNSAGSSHEGGGGIDNFGTLVVNDSTFAANSAGTGLGGAITTNSVNMATLTATDSTFSGNTAGIGSGIFISGATAVGATTLNGDVIVGNPSTLGRGDDDIAGVIFPTGANNVVGTEPNGGLTNGVNGNQVGVTPAQVALGPLADNGGPTQTFALLPGSVAIGMGQTGVDPTDQRGDPRPTTTRADAGAFQTQNFLTNPPSVSVAFGPAGEVIELVNSAGVLTQFSAAGAQVLGGGVRSASVAFGPNGEVLEVVTLGGVLTQFDSTGAHQLGGAGVQSASIAFGPGGEVLEIVLTDGSLRQFDSAGAHVLGTSGVQSASVAVGPNGDVLEVVTTAGVLTQFDFTGAHQLGGAGVESAGAAYTSNSLVLDIIFSDGTLDQFDASGVHRLGMVS
jgi:hypothetical protein